MANSPESRIITECTTDLVTGLASVDLESVADDLWGRTMISEEVYHALQLPNKTKTQKARDMVMNVSNRVKVDPKPVFTEFLEVLRSHAGLGPVVKTLEEKYCKNSEASNTAPPTQPTTSHPTTRGGASAAPPSPHDDTIQQLLQYVRIDMDKLKQSPDHSTLHEIAKKQGHEWQSCALKLKLTQSEIDNIISNFGRVQEQRYEALKVWKQKRSFMATYKELVEVFIEQERLDIATFVCELLK